jgi:hypothetical protein
MDNVSRCDAKALVIDRRYQQHHHPAAHLARRCCMAPHHSLSPAATSSTSSAPHTAPALGGPRCCCCCCCWVGGSRPDPKPWPRLALPATPLRRSCCCGGVGVVRGVLPRSASGCRAAAVLWRMASASATTALRRASSACSHETSDGVQPSNFVTAVGCCGADSLRVLLAVCYTHISVGRV